MSEVKPPDESRTAPDGFIDWPDYAFNGPCAPNDWRTEKGRQQLAALRHRCEAAEKLAKDNEYAFDAKVEEFDHQLAERLATRTAERDDFKMRMEAACAVARANGLKLDTITAERDAANQRCADLERERDALAAEVERLRSKLAQAKQTFDDIVESAKETP